MMEEIVNEDFEKISSNIKIPDEAVIYVVSSMEKIIKSKKSNILWLAYQQGQIFKKFIPNENFLDIIKKLGIRKSTVLFKMFIVKPVNKYLRVKKSYLFLHFSKKNFRIIKENCHENASKFEQVYHFFFNKYPYFKIV